MLPALTTTQVQLDLREVWEPAARAVALAALAGIGAWQAYMLLFGSEAEADSTHPNQKRGGGGLGGGGGAARVSFTNDDDDSTTPRHRATFHTTLQTEPSPSQPTTAGFVLTSTTTASTATTSASATTTPAHVVAAIASASADVILGFKSGSARDLALTVQRVVHDRRIKGLGVPKTMQLLSTRAGAGTTLLGFLAELPTRASTVTATVPAQSLPTMLPALHQLAARASSTPTASTACVLTITLEHVAPDLTQRTHCAALSLLADMGVPVLLSATGQDCHDHALVAAHYANTYARPIAHVIDGVRLANTHQQIRILPDPAVTALLMRNDESSGTQASSAHPSPSNSPPPVSPTATAAASAAHSSATSGFGSRSPSPPVDAFPSKQPTTTAALQTAPRTGQRTAHLGGITSTLNTHPSTADRLRASLDAVGAAVHHQLPFFTYTGPPTTSVDLVVVVLAPVSPTFVSVAAEYNRRTNTGGHTTTVGVLVVNVLRPWDAYAFRAALPPQAGRICVVETAAPAVQFTAHHQLLTTDVCSSVSPPPSPSSPRVISACTPHVVVRHIEVDARGVQPALAAAVIATALEPAPLPHLAQHNNNSNSNSNSVQEHGLGKQLQQRIDNSNAAILLTNTTAREVLRLHSSATSPTSTTALAAVAAATSDDGVVVNVYAHLNQSVERLCSSFVQQVHAQCRVPATAFTSEDACFASGVSRTQLCIGGSNTHVRDSPAAAAAVVADVELLAELAPWLARELCEHASVFVVAADADAAVNHLKEHTSPSALRLLSDKHIAITFINSTEGTHAANVSTAVLLARASHVLPALHSLDLGAVLDNATDPLVREVQSSSAELLSAARAAPTTTITAHHLVDSTPNNNSAHPASNHHDTDASSGNSADEGDDSGVDEESATAFIPRVRVVAPTQPETSGAQQLTASDLAKRVVFQDTFSAESGHRPGYAGMYRVRLTKNQRLTPEDYHRNIFHLEMDIRGTGLEYRIGDALGVYGRNDRDDVRSFLAMVDIGPDALVEVDHTQQAGCKEVMTAMQLFTDRLDVFGKPSQKFYAAIAAHTSDSYERAKLEWLGSDDKEGFRLRQLETYTFADVLEEFPSARPPLSVLATIIPPIKPRHYSIASSMNKCPHSVHLLVVLVSWTTPKGRERYGQCTRYLSQLCPDGDEDVFLTVDIKPSVMHMPADARRPIIMAGLGTGMAPFRAFLQERQYQREQGLEVGPMLLYFGARHRSEEYLYGDYLDEMLADGILTRLGLAFSRDQKDKVYIQHKIAEDKAVLARHLLEGNGHFYLCGPTWPVPDVKAALVNGIVDETARTRDDVEELIEELKEAGRYVLEVY